MENYQIRSKVHPKQRVAVLLKEDYENGNLTYGTVDENLTKTDTHYRGIKVRIKPENETEEEKEIRKPLFHSVPVFQIKISFPCSDNGSLRCSCSRTIGALASVVLLFLNDRPVVSERSEFRRSVKEKAR